MTTADATTSPTDEVLAALGRLRVATGFDVHAFGGDGPIRLGGVDIDHEHGLEGHSDADAVAHCVIDALLGGAGRDEDVGTCFPSHDESLKNIDSMELLEKIVGELNHQGCTIVNVDVTIMAQAPRISPHRTRIRQRLAAVLGVGVDRITVRATTTDRLGFVGRGEGVGAQATALVLQG